jgi:hypothetical protein
MYVQGWTRCMTHPRDRCIRYSKLHANALPHNRVVPISLTKLRLTLSPSVTLDPEGRIFTFNTDLKRSEIRDGQVLNIPFPFRPVRLATYRDIALQPKYQLIYPSSCHSNLRQYVYRQHGHRRPRNAHLDPRWWSRKRFLPLFCSHPLSGAH